MKKRILLYLCIVATLALVFALSVSAEELQNDKGVYYSTSNEFGTVNILEVMTPVTSSIKTDAENYTTTYYSTHSLEQRVVLANGDGTFSTYPTAYIMNINNSAWKMMALNPAKINDHTGYSYTMESIIRIEIPEGITRIGHDERYDINIKTATNCVYLSFPASYATSSGTQMGNAFSGMTSLVTIDMSKCTKLTSILSGWFYNCTSLTTILWPQSGLTTINHAAFKNCTSLVEVVIPDGVNFPSHTQNDYGAFGGCTSLTTVTLPSSVTNLHKRIFDGCTSLTTVNLPEGLTAVQDQAFRNTAVTEVVFPSTLETIGNYMYQNCASLTTVSIPATVTAIGDYAFQNCKQLASITFNGQKRIGTASFENCTSLTKVVLPEGLTYLGNCAFKGCKALASVTLPSTLEEMYDNSHFYDTALTEVIGLENTKLTYIPASAFRGLKNWTPDVIKIPSTVTKIGNYAFADVGMKSVILSPNLKEFNGAEAFVNCKNLATVYVPSTITNFNSNTFTNKQRSDILFFVTSTDNTYLATVKDKFAGADVITLDTYLANKDTYAKGRHIISGYNVCDAFYDSIHSLDPEKSNACAGICANCLEAQLAANPVHNYVTTIKYTNYLADGVKTEKCQNAGCVHSGDTPKETVVNAIVYSFDGFSTKIASDGLVIKYSVNREALDEYARVNGIDVELGFVVAAKHLSGEELIASNGNATANVMKISVITHSASSESGVYYSGAELKITGDWNGTVDVDGVATDVKEVKFYMAGYIISNGVVSYLNNGGSSVSADYISYSDCVTK